MNCQPEPNNSKWNRSLNWVSTKITNLWKPFSQENQEQQKVFKKENVLQKISKIKVNVDAGKKDSGRWVDPKLRIMEKLRKKSSNHLLQEKIKRVNCYFSKKQTNSEKPCDLLCPICLQFMVKPVLTVCGHNFCMRCLDQTLLFKADCPSCRFYLRGTQTIQCQSLQQVILRQISRHSTSQFDLYMQSQAETSQWLQLRNPNISLLSIGSKLDIKDTEYIWCKSTINQIFNKNNKICSILVHYEGWNSIYDEVIEINSQRIANYGFYTNRLEIPHYRSHGVQIEEQRMYSYVVTEEFNEIHLPRPITLMQLGIQNSNDSVSIDSSNSSFRNQNGIFGYQSHQIQFSGQQPRQTVQQQIQSPYLDEHQLYGFSQYDRNYFSFREQMWNLQLPNQEINEPNQRTTQSLVSDRQRQNRSINQLNISFGEQFFQRQARQNQYEISISLQNQFQADLLREERCEKMKSKENQQEKQQGQQKQDEYEIMKKEYNKLYEFRNKLGNEDNSQVQKVMEQKQNKEQNKIDIKNPESSLVELNKIIASEQFCEGTVGQSLQC